MSSKRQITTEDALDNTADAVLSSDKANAEPHAKFSEEKQEKHIFNAAYVFNNLPAEDKLFVVVFEASAIFFTTQKKAENHIKALLERGITARMEVFTRE